MEEIIIENTLWNKLTEKQQVRLKTWQSDLMQYKFAIDVPIRIAYWVFELNNPKAERFNIMGFLNIFENE